MFCWPIPGNFLTECIDNSKFGCWHLQLLTVFMITVHVSMTTVYVSTPFVIPGCSRTALDLAEHKLDCVASSGMWQNQSYAASMLCLCSYQHNILFLSLKIIILNTLKISLIKKIESQLRFLNNKGNAFWPCNNIINKKINTRIQLTITKTDLES